MNEARLPEKWRLQFEKGDNRCVGNVAAVKDEKRKKRDQRITLKNISGSFVVLLVGIFSSFVAFIIERVLRPRKAGTTANLPTAAVTKYKAEDDRSNHQSKKIIITSPTPAPTVNKLNKEDREVDTPDNESSTYNIKTSTNIIESDESAIAKINLTSKMTKGPILTSNLIVTENKKYLKG